MLKRLKRNWKRLTAGTLAGVVAFCSVDVSQFVLTSYAFSRDYGVCIDNHEYSDNGSNCANDRYVMITKQTKDLAHGSEEWKAAIEYNKQVLLDKVGNGVPRTVMKTLWSTIDLVATSGETGGMTKEDVEEARYWANYIKVEVGDAIAHQYWEEGFPTEITSHVTEAELGIVRHGPAGEVIIKRDPLLTALCDYDYLFPGKGESWKNVSVSPKYPHGACWLIPRMGTGWLESYEGNSGVGQWPIDMASHSVTVQVGEPVTDQMVRNAALSIQGNAFYLGTGKMDADGNVIKDSISSSESTGSTDTDDEDYGDDPDSGDDSDGSASGSSSGSNTYYINMTKNFHGNAGELMIWNKQTGSWQSILLNSTAPVQINGWTIQIEPSHMTTMSCAYVKLTYTGTGAAPELMGYFQIPIGSVVELNGTTWDSPLDFAADIMEVYECVSCPSGRRPIEKHQHFVKVHSLENTVTYPCFKVGASTDPILPEGDAHFCVFRHEEDWQTDYNVQLDKMDYETGKPLEGAVFTLYEKFNDQDELDESGDGSATLYEGSDSGDYPDSEWQSGYTSSPVTWDGFRRVNSYTTDGNGHIEAGVTKTYHYEKTYCDGHPAPTFVPIPELPELEINEETGEDNSEEIEAAQAEIEAAKEQNRALAESWASSFDECVNMASEREGVHFHWLGDGVMEETIREIASGGGAEGETPDGGPTECFGMDDSYEKSGCKQDTEDTYEKFISLEYSYTWKESRARDGYVLHDTHPDDVPIEVITTDSSQNGANARFASEKYSKYITTNSSVNSAAAAIAEAGSVTLFDVLVSNLSSDQEKDGDTDTKMKTEEPFIRKGYDFEKTGFSALKETALDAVKFLKETILDVPDASGSDAKEEETATPSDMESGKDDKVTASASAAEKETEERAEKDSGRFVTGFRGLSLFSLNGRGAAAAAEGEEQGAGAGFEEAFTEAFTDPQTDSFETETGPDDNYSHCNDSDGEGDSWRVYDHRTEGEIHFNKRDFDLSDDASQKFDTYGQENGDGTLEGAVYGLFADEDLVHPDGKTGTVYKEGDLVAIATTDQDGNGSFMAFTEAPGVVYDYERGSVVTTEWNAKAPKNLYRNAAKRQENTDLTAHGTGWRLDDYTADKDGISIHTERVYDANEENNGNCWIGRPLILGKYYIKELSRSEGYELSINGRANAYTNHNTEDPDSDFEVDRKADETKGSVAVSKNLYINGQESVGAENEPFFRVSSDGTTANKGYDIVVSKLPQGTKFYRKDSAVVQETSKQQTGWITVEKKDAFGNIIYKTASSDTSDPVYVGDGSYNTVTETKPAVIVTNNIIVKGRKDYDPDAIDAAILGNQAAEPDADGNPYYPDEARLTRTFDANDAAFLKAKLESALRKGGSVVTPYQVSDGGRVYSTESYSVYSRGIRKGEVDTFGVSGVEPGEIAKKTAYGPQIVKVTIAKTTDGKTLTNEDMIRNLIQYYIDNSQYGYGGLDRLVDHSDRVDFYLYASDLYTTGGTFAARAVDGDGYEIYVRKEFVPDDRTLEPYYVYVKYTEDGDEPDAFGYYTNLKTATRGTTTYLNAVCAPDSVIMGDGTITQKTVESTKYYKEGETVYDQNGKKIPETETVAKYEDVTAGTLKTQWTELRATYEKSTGNHIIHITMPYTDAYGNVQTDEKGALEIELKAVCPETMHTLTKKDHDAMSEDEQYRFEVGDQVVSGLYEVEVLKARASVYLDHAKKLEAKSGSYVEDVELTYPGQKYTYQDGAGVPGQGTIETPIQVYERPIRQKIRVMKELDTLKEPVTAWFCLNCGYANEEANIFCHFCMHERTTEVVKTIRYENDTYSIASSKDLTAEHEARFSFKIYLQSNLERLYANAKGEIVWKDRNGKVMTPVYQDPDGDGNYETFLWAYEDKGQVDFPEKDKINGNILLSANVQKIFTNVKHNTYSKTVSALANNSWARYDDPETVLGSSGVKQAYSTSLRPEGDWGGYAINTADSLYQYKGKNEDVEKSDRIRDTKDHAPVYHRLLETVEYSVTDGKKERDLRYDNYEKFFDAIAAANTDVWDDDMHSTFDGTAMKNYLYDILQKQKECRKNLKEHSAIH